MYMTDITAVSMLNVWISQHLQGAVNSLSLQ